MQEDIGYCEKYLTLLWKKIHILHAFRTRRQENLKINKGQFQLIQIESI